MSQRASNGDIKLLKFLAQQGVINDEIATRIEKDISETHDSQCAIELLSREGLVDEEAVARALANRLRLPVVNLATHGIDHAVTGLVREEVAAKFGALPIRLHNDTVIIAVHNPLDREAMQAIAFAIGRPVRPEVATYSALQDAIHHAYHLEESLNSYLDGVSADGEAEITQLPASETDLSKLVRDTQLPPVVKLLNVILVDGIRGGASDIHIETTLADVRVRYRIDGVLQEAFRLPKWVQDPLTARCKVLASLDITERRVPQDGRIRINYQGKSVDLRVSSLPTQFGEKVTMRILDASSGPRGIDSLTLQKRDMECVRHAIARPQGIVLVTGPTGSGKTTTLYSMLTEMTSPETNIVTIENPIEYQLKGVNQVEINEKQGLTFASTLRSILRQDPDIILVGEIRDQETAQIAARAAQTGHLVLSTLHTNDSVATISRLLDLGIDPFLVATATNAIIAQRLVRRICKGCAEPYTPDSHTLSLLGLRAQNVSFMRGKGCKACRNSGLVGREAVFEVMPMTPAMAKLVERKAPESALRRQAKEDGMITLEANAVAKVLSGTTTAEEVLRVVDGFEGSAYCPTCNQVMDDSFSVCPHCATPLHNQCRSCGERLETGWRTCPYCGSGSTAEGSIEENAAARTGAPIIIEETSDVPTPARRFRALVIDDEADFRFLLQTFLEHSGIPFDVTTAANGREGLECAEQLVPDIILLDIMMPELDGFEVCKRLRSKVRTAFVPILMLTALDDAANRTRGYLAGTDDYVGKPFERAELMARVRRIIHRTYGSPDAEGPLSDTERQDTAAHIEHTVSPAPSH
jgi:type IV pilus assembly protein PilB